MIYWDNSSVRYEVDSVSPNRRISPKGGASARSPSVTWRSIGRPSPCRTSATASGANRAQDIVITNDPDRLGSALAIEPKTPTKVGRVDVRVSIIQLSGVPRGRARGDPSRQPAARSRPVAPGSHLGSGLSDRPTTSCAVPCPEPPAAATNASEPHLTKGGPSELAGAGDSAYSSADCRGLPEGGCGE
jgi:hypothetical protein